MTKKAQKNKTLPLRIDSFNLPNGKIISGKYKVIRQLGTGWEGEVYMLEEVNTKIVRAAKFFYPQRNINNKTLIRYATKLHKLRNCPVIIHYYAQENFRFQNQNITFLVSEYVEGEILANFLKRQKGNRLHAFQALHLLHALATGVEAIHKLKEYHGDLHKENIIVHRHGLGFELKLVDMYFWDMATPQNINDDVCDLIKIFYDAVGGVKHYKNQPHVVKNIACGLKKNLILKKYRTAGQLRQALEKISWE